MTLEPAWFVSIATTDQKIRGLARGEPLFRQGDDARAIYFVDAGALRLERRTFDGRLVALHTARRGEFFAEASLFADSYHCDATAIEPSQVRAFGKTAVLEAVRSDPAAALSLLAMMARQLHRVRERLELRNVRSALERVTLYLDLQSRPDGVVPVEGELQDFAADLGLTREALYRTLAALEEAGAIERRGREIFLKKSVAT